MQTVGVRELKNRLTHYLDEVKNGENVVVTDRGTPVAIFDQRQLLFPVSDNYNSRGDGT